MRDGLITGNGKEAFQGATGVMPQFFRAWFEFLFELDVPVHGHLHKHVPRGLDKTSWFCCEKNRGLFCVTLGMDAAECRRSVL